MTTHSSILPWKIPWTEKPGRLQSMVCKESDMTECTCTHTHTYTHIHTHTHTHTYVKHIFDTTLMAERTKEPHDESKRGK